MQKIKIDEGRPRFIDRMKRIERRFIGACEWILPSVVTETYREHRGIGRLLATS